MVQATFAFALAGMAALSSAVPAPMPSTASNPQSNSKPICKEGFAYNKFSPTNMDAFPKRTDCMPWAYDWEAKATQNGDAVTYQFDNYHFVPMLKNADAMFKDAWIGQNGKGGDSAQAIAGGATHVLSFNEPDQIGEANLPVEDAVRLHKELVDPLRESNVKIGAPAVTNAPIEDLNKGVNYLRTFLKQLTDKNCKVDFLTAHWHWDEANHDPIGVKTFTDHLEAMHNVDTSLDVWVTEWRVPSNPVPDAATFVHQAKEWMESKDWIARYSYHKTDDLVNANGALKTDPLSQAVAKPFSGY